MGATALRQTCRRHLKLSITPIHFFFRISKIFAVFNAFSSSTFKIMALNTAKNLRILKREISLSE